MKKLFIILLAVALSVGFMQTATFAEKGRKGEGKGHHDKMSTKDKLFKKIKMVYMHKEELGVSDEQLAELKKMKIALKKDLIKMKADIDLVKIDIKAEMYEDKIDLAKVNKLIDQKYEIKKAKAKATVKGLADLKGILSEKQMKELKGLCMQKMMHHKK